MVDFTIRLLELVFFPFSSSSPLVLLPFGVLMFVTIISFFYNLMRVK